MSHELTIREDGFVEAAYSLQPAWHGLGTVFDHVMSSAEALTAAGLDWQVKQDEVYRYDKMFLKNKEEWSTGTKVEPVLGGTNEYVQIPGYLLNVRRDNDLVLGMVSDQYKLVQNGEAFGFLDALVEGHEMRYESAFSLYGGRRVVMLAKMPGHREVVPGDPLLPYVLMSLSHDGTGAIKFGPTAVRVVCANTYALAERGHTLKELAVRHTGDIKSKLQAARDILGMADRQFAQYAEIGQVLAQRRLTREEWRHYLDMMCPELDPLDPDYTDRRAEAITETRHAIALCYRNERQDTAPETAWAAFNAVGEHIDHLPRRGASGERRAEARFSVCLYGVGRNMKQRALEAACKMAGVESAA